MTITSPVSMETHERVITLEGFAEERSSLTVNGENVLLQEDSKFSVPLTLHVGINAVHVEAKNSAGRIRSQQLFLLRT